MYRRKANSMERTLALTLAALTLFVVANSFPFLGFSLSGQVQQTTLFSGVQQLYHDDMPVVAMVVFVTTILAPLLHMMAMLYILLPLRAGRVPVFLPQVFRLLFQLKPWGMMEIFMLGILVSVVKLAAMADILVGTGLWAFAGLILLLAASAATFDADSIWRRAEACR